VRLTGGVAVRVQAPCYADSHKVNWLTSLLNSVASLLPLRGLLHLTRPRCCVSPTGTDDDNRLPATGIS
jgi:hypothetical protein